MDKIIRRLFNLPKVKKARDISAIANYFAMKIGRKTYDLNRVKTILKVRYGMKQAKRILRLIEEKI